MNDLLVRLNLESVSSLVIWNVEKARNILIDLEQLFIADDYSKAIDDIKRSYGSIHAKLGIMDDMLNSTEDAVQPIEDAAPEIVLAAKLSM